MERALLVDPENFNMRYNFACALSVYLKDKEGALEMLGPVFETITLLAAAEVRLAAEPGKQAIGAN
ncbi:MAG: hypothetical protein ACREVI_14005 [Steroidobacteraceae bacterium]